MLLEFKSKSTLAFLTASLLVTGLAALGQSSLQGAATKSTTVKTSSLKTQQGGTESTGVPQSQHAHVQKTTRKAVAHTTYQKPKSFWARHPMVKDATIGAGVGTLAGGATGLISHRGIMHGALVGAGAGAGVGAIHASKTLKRHPYMRDAAEGGVGGLGLGLAASRSHEKAAVAAGVGAAAGLGYRYFKNNMH
jgi:hypothetical protein